MFIETLGNSWHMTPLNAVQFVLQARAARPGIRRADMMEPSGEIAAGPPAIAYVNDGRWVARCPLCLKGAELVDHAEPIFYCLTCYNAAVQNAWLPVRFPEDREAIEEALLARATSSQSHDGVGGMPPVMMIHDKIVAGPFAMHWTPDETVEDLLLENAAMQKIVIIDGGTGERQ